LPALIASLHPGAHRQIYRLNVHFTETSLKNYKFYKKNLKQLIIADEIS